MVTFIRNDFVKGVGKMRYLDNIELWVKKMEAAELSKVLSRSEQEEWNSMGYEQRVDKLTSMLSYPVADFSVVYRWYFRMKWVEALEAIKANTPLTLLEIGAGDTDMIPQIMAKGYKHELTSYFTANMNKKLTASLKEKTKNLPIKVDVIEDAAQKIGDYLGNEKFDVVVFEHSVNDVLQAIIGERDGIDTTNEDWFVVLPRMIELIKNEYLNQTLEASVKEEFLGLIQSCLDVLKPGGYIVITHFMYQYDLDLGYDYYLWENMLSIVRPWFSAIEGGTEVSFENFDSQWWLFLRKN
jgi:SAM-dependent methyltransferase